ncbi:MAG TPA: MBL fold metallo-hydrolase [Deltaproteobacteria bacterium]|nr:MBL fold metallo-hydrolase [Deltaproteobacteria bacterium]
MIEITWTGAAGLIISSGEHTVCIDPFVTRPGKMDVFFKRLHPDETAIENFTKGLKGNVPAIVVSHTHFDHALDVPEIARRLGCRVFGSTSLERLMEISGQPGRTRVCKYHEHFELADGISLTMFPSLHGRVFLGRVPYEGEIMQNMHLPFRAGDYRLGDIYMPRIEIGGISIMHAGSAGCSVADLEGWKCDVLFMCVPGWKRSPDYTSALLKTLRPGIIVPFHYDDFTMPLSPCMMPRVMPFSDMKGFMKRIAHVLPGAVIQIPLPYSPMEFE